MSYKDKLIWPTPEEDAAITAAALDDADNPPLTDEVYDRMVPLSRIHELDAVKVDIWLDSDVVAAFQADGQGWHKRLRAALREWAVQRGLVE